MTQAAKDYADYIGEEVGPYLAWDEVTAPMIRHWCEAMGDDNPVYRDREAAKAAGYPDIIAPPTMLQVWTMRGLQGRYPPGSETRNPFAVMEALSDAGYDGVVAVNCKQSYARPIVVGDSIHHRSVITDVGEQKTTALGTGHFVTEQSRFYNQDEELVGTMEFRLFIFRPHEAATGGRQETSSDGPPKIGRMRPVRSYDTEFFWKGLEEGELRIQRCGNCGALRHPPAPMCPKCQSLDHDYGVASGRGEIYSFTILHHPAIPPFDYPLVSGLVELEEGVRIVTEIVGVDRRDVKIGMAVEVEFAEVEEGLVLHRFRPAGKDRN